LYLLTYNIYVFIENVDVLVKYITLVCRCWCDIVV